MSNVTRFPRMKTSMHQNTLRSTLVAGLATLGMLLGSAADGSAQAKAPETIKLFVGRSHRITSAWDVAGVSLTDPAIADVQVLTPRMIMLSGKAVGTTDVIMWSDAGDSTEMRLEVEIDLDRLRGDLGKMFPGATLDVQMSEGVLVIEGSVANAEQADQLHRYLEQRNLPFMDRSTMPGVQQVQAKIRFAEVSRTGLRKLGVTMFDVNSDSSFGTLIGPTLGDGNGIFDFLSPNSLGASDTGFTTTIFANFTKSDTHFFIDALAENKYLRVLAEPTLVASSGEEASFLAGGEFPIPVVQGGAGGASSSISVEFKQFGVALAFRPIVLGDGKIRLLVRSEVSQRDDANGVVIPGTDALVPSIATRRSETTLELNSGQTFAMAGLLQNNVLALRQQIPGLGDLPVIGPLFRSVSYQNFESELVALVTVDLVEPSDSQVFQPLPGEEHKVPNDWEFYYEGDLQANTPGRLANSEGAYVNALGLQGLKGPGAWAYYGQEPARARPTGESPKAVQEEQAQAEEEAAAEAIDESEQAPPATPEPAPDAPAKY